ncbi:MAG: transposase [Acidobacteriota bacterium]
MKEIGKDIKYKKRVRLKDFNYKGYNRYFVTICTNNNKNLFINKDLIDWLISELKEISNKHHFNIWAYCFMPDHLHLLTEGNDEEADMRKFIAAFKQKTGFLYKKKFNNQLWEINYYEHVLRKEETIKEVAFYIFNNPLRKGIVKNYQEYPYSGSFMFDINDY